MIFNDLQEILERINSPRNTDLPKAVVMYNKLNMLVNGVNVQDYIEPLDGYENKKQEKLRRKVSKSMKHIFAALLRPTDLVFTARGGSESYNLSEAQQQHMKSIVSGLTSDGGLKGWMKMNWKNKLITDPNGLIFYEVGEDETYPTYKPVTSVLDYVIDGIIPEYVIFKTHKEEDGFEYYRVVDDAFDRIVKVSGETIYEVEDEIYPNYFGFVPAMTCSDIPDPNYDIKLSPIDAVIDIAVEYLRDMSIHSIYKFLHGYPVFWRYVSDCPVCDGLGKIEGETCWACSGTGKKLSKDVSDAIGLAIPDPGDPSLAPPAGYVSPDIATWQEQRAELDWLYKGMFFAVWGSNSNEEAKNETATGRFIDVQPKHDRLSEFSYTADNVMSKSINIIGIFYFSNWRGGVYKLGRRYMIESPDAILQRYEKLRKEGAPEQVLNYTLILYFESEFDQQPMMLAKHIKLMQVEPFLHHTLSEVIQMDVPEVDYMAKLYFSQWEGAMTMDKIIFTEATTLRDDLYNYIKEKSNEKRVKSTEVSGLA